MSGNQESQISLPTWRCSNFNAAIPIKKRKYFVQPQLPAMEEADDISVGRSALDSSVADENPKMIGGSKTNTGEPTLSLPSVSVGNADKAVSIGNISVDQIRVKVEEPNFPIHSSPVAGFDIPSSSNILGSSLGKLPVAAEHSGVVLKTQEVNLRGECQTEASVSAGKTQKHSSHWESEESTALKLSLSKGLCVPHNTDSISTNSGVNRENWDLNTTMDAWEDPLDRRTRVKTTGAFSNSNRSLDDVKTPSCRDTNVIAESISEKQKEIVGFKSPALSLKQYDHQVNSLSLGLSSYPIEKSPSLSATTSDAKAACTSVSRPILIAGNMNSVNLRTVKSEVIEERVRQETENTQVCPIGLSISGVKQEAVARFRQEKSLSSSVSLISVKAEPVNFTESEVSNSKDGALNHSHIPIVQPNESLDLPTSSTSNQKDNSIPCSNGICNAPMSLDGMTNNSGQRSRAASGKLCEVLKHGGVDMTSSCSGHGDHNLNASGVNVTSLTEAKILDDNKTSISEELRRNSRGTEGNEAAHAECGVSDYVEEKGSQPAVIGNTGNKHIKEGSASLSTYKFKKCSVDESCLKLVEMASTEVQFEKLQRGIFDGSGEKEGEQTTHQIIHGNEGMSGVSTVTGGNIENREIVDNTSPLSYKAEISTIDDDTPMEISEGSQSRNINLVQVSNNSPSKALDASESFVPLQMERDRLPDSPLEPRRYPLRGSDESCKFSGERYHGKIMRSPRLNFIPDRRRFTEQTESNLHDRDTKSFEFDNHGHTRRGGTFMSNYRGRRPANDEGTPYSHSFTRRNPNFSFTHRGPRNKEDGSPFHGFRDGEKFTRGSQYNNTEQVFTGPHRPYRGRNGSFSRGRTKFTHNSKREFPGFRSRSPVRSRERSPGPSSSFRHRSQEDFSDFSHRRSPSSYRTERISSPDTGYSRETVVRRHNSPPHSYRPSNPGRGRGYARGRGGYERGRGYTRGRGYGRDANSFRKPYDRGLYRNQGNLNKLDPRERVDYSDDFVEGPIHSERFGRDVSVERRRFGYRHDGSSSFNNGDYAPSNVENDPDAVRIGQDIDMEIEEQGSLVETDGKNNNSAENASGRSKNMEEEETSKQGKIWQPDEPGVDERGGDEF